MSKKISFLIKFSLGFLLFLTFSYADSLLIIPKKKPQLSKEVIEERISKNIIKKPSVNFIKNDIFFDINFTK